MLERIREADNPDWRTADIVHVNRGYTFGGFEDLEEFDDFCDLAVRQVIADYHQCFPPERGVVPPIDTLSKRGKPVSEYFSVKALRTAFDFKAPRVIALDADVGHVNPETKQWFYTYNRGERPPSNFTPVLRGIAGVALVHLFQTGQDELLGVAGINFSRELTLAPERRRSNAPLTWHIRNKTGKHVIVADSAHKLFPGLIQEELR